MMDLPLIDLARFRDGSRAEKDRIAGQVDRACRQTGFFALNGHAISEANARAVEEAARSFFHLPLSAKRRVAQRRGDEIRGYIGYGAAALGTTRGEAPSPDWKESFSIGPVDVDASDPYITAPGSRFHFAPNLWPDQPTGFADVWVDYYRELERLAADLARLFAFALGLAEDHFVDKIDRHISILGAMYYPAQERPPLPGQLRAGPHSDFGSFTLLRPGGAPGGLEILAPAGAWESVRAPPSAYLVNLGDLMARWTDDRWRSSLHRVANPPPGASGERLSIGFFHQPNYDALIACLPGCGAAGRPPKYAPVTSGEHLYRQFSSQVQRPAQ